MIKTRQIVLAAAIAVAFVGSSFAEEKIVLASLGDVNGKVLVNQGKGFVTAKDGMEVRTGDRVIALDKASAKVVYSDGCVTDLKENKLLSMDGKGCQKQAVNFGGDNIKLAQAIGGSVTDTPPGGGDVAGTAGAPVAGGLTGLQMVGIGLVVVGAGAAIANSGGSDSRPVSGQ